MILGTPKTREKSAAISPYVAGGALAGGGVGWWLNRHGDWIDQLGGALMGTGVGTIPGAVLDQMITGGQPTGPAKPLPPGKDQGKNGVDFVEPGVRDVKDLVRHVQPGNTADPRFLDYWNANNAARARDGLPALPEGKVTVDPVKSIDDISLMATPFSRWLNLPSDNKFDFRAEISGLPERGREVNGFEGPALKTKDMGPAGENHGVATHEVTHLMGLRDVKPLFGRPNPNPPGFYPRDIFKDPSLPPYAIMSPIEAGPGIHDMRYRTFFPDTLGKGIPTNPDEIVRILSRGTDKERADLASHLGSDGKRLMNMVDIAKRQTVAPRARTGAQVYKFRKALGRPFSHIIDDDLTGRPPTSEQIPASQLLYDLIRGYWDYAKNQQSQEGGPMLASNSRPLRKTAGRLSPLKDFLFKVAAGGGVDMTQGSAPTVSGETVGQQTVPALAKPSTTHIPQGGTHAPAAAPMAQSFRRDPHAASTTGFSGALAPAFQNPARGKVSDGTVLG